MHVLRLVEEKRDHVHVSFGYKLGCFLQGMLEYAQHVPYQITNGDFKMTKKPFQFKYTDYI